MLWLLCLPITHVIDVPDSVTEVLTSLALVAAINWLVICAAQASVSQARCAYTLLVWCVPAHRMCATSGNVGWVGGGCRQHALS